MTPTQLAARCEAAEGASYELDCLIWDLLYPGERDGRFERVNAAHGGRLGPADKDGYVKPLRAFTASIDAALTLVPEGYNWLVRSPSKNGPRDAGRFFARIESSDFESVTWGKGEDWITNIVAGEEAIAWASTPALALAAAALKARA